MQLLLKTETSQKQMKPWKKQDGLTVMVTESVRKTEPKHPLNYITHLMLLKDKQLQFLFLNKQKKWVLK